MRSNPRSIHPALAAIVVSAMVLVCAAAARAGEQALSPEYRAVQDELCRGWNTWDVSSVMAQALLPDGFTLRVGIKHETALNGDAFLGDAQIGKRGKDDEDIFPGPHTWDGSYTELRAQWKGHTFTVQSAHDGEDVVILVTPLSSLSALPPTVVFSAGVLWGRPGGVLRTGDHIEFKRQFHSIGVYWTGKDQPVQAIPVSTPYFAEPLTEAVGVCTGRPRTLDEIRSIIGRMKPAGDGGVRQSIESVMGWDTLYDPSHARVISPVSRLWSTGWGGYVLFDWDTFFAATLASTGNRNLAYADALEVLKESTPEGFVPNYARPGGWKSFDRSEPPVAAITFLGLYRTYHEDWILRDAFPAMLTWNRWWDAHRSMQGYLVLGSDAANRPLNPDDKEVGTLQGARYETGLDNSPMYDDPPFHKDTGRIPLADVGMTSLYVADCKSLAEIARILGKGDEARELLERSARYSASLQTLWDEGSGIFLNRNLDTGVQSRRLSPTNFYPMLAGVATPRQAVRMVREHLMNPDEFWGKWVIPSIARNDPAFKDQNYWRGRIWGPMNYLVYLGLRSYDVPEARAEFARRSLELFNLEWKAKGHVHENYNAITGDGDDVSSSDRFYHWGALLGYLSLIDQEGAQAPLVGAAAPLVKP